MSYIGERLDDLFNRLLESSEPIVRIQDIVKKHPDKVALISSFGAQSIIMLDLAAKSGFEVPVLHVDTGDVPEETKAYRELMLVHYGLSVTIIRQREGETKVSATRRGLSMLKCEAVLSGIRADQTDNRMGLKLSQSPAENNLGVYKYHPILDQDTQWAGRYIAQFSDDLKHPAWKAGRTTKGGVAIKAPSCNDECGLHLMGDGAGI